MGKQLPEYEEIPIELNMAAEVAAEYKRIEKVFVKILKKDKKVARKVTSAFMSLLTVYPDQPYDMKTIINPITGATLIEPKDVSSFDVLNEKDTWLLEKVKEKVKNGERVIVYTSWIQIDTQEKLLKLFGENNIKADALTAKVAPIRREGWVEKRVKDGVQVLITNPSLVETGLDLNDFTTLIYYNIGYKLFTLRQSSRRSWRINQKAPRIEVYFLYFSNVMQHRAIRLMASKLAVAGIIEGNFTDEGLAAMSECQDLTTLLAQELTLGIKDEVEDLGAVFKKMAMLKPEEELFEGEAVEITEPSSAEAEPFLEVAEPKAPDSIQSKVIVLSETQSHQKIQTEPSEQEGKSSFLSVLKTSITQTQTTKKKTIVQCEGQISLFDCFKVASA